MHAHILIYAHNVVSFNCLNFARFAILCNVVTNIVSNF